MGIWPANPLGHFAAKNRGRRDFRSWAGDRLLGGACSAGGKIPARLLRGCRRRPGDFVRDAGRSIVADRHGLAGNNGRDADRIVAAAKKAGISRIDYVLITHFHDDHVGGVPQLAARISIGTFIDHGENRETTDAVTVKGWQAYQAVLAQGKYQRISAQPGDALPIKGMNASIVSSDGALIEKPPPGAGHDNPYCKDAEQFPADTTENLRSLGTFINFGKLRILDLGDLTHDKEMQLVCPKTRSARSTSTSSLIMAGRKAAARRSYTASLPGWQSWTMARRRVNSVGRGYHQEITWARGPLATAFFRGGWGGAQRRRGVYRQSRRPRRRERSGVDRPYRREL